MKPVEVRCVCGTLFGFENDGKLQIKHRDLYRTIIGGTVEGYCRKCGAMVRWTAKATK